MRLVVATTETDPLAGEFWQAYTLAGGPPPAAVMFLASRRSLPTWRRAIEAALLFGPVAGIQAWRSARSVRATLRAAPNRIFPGTEAFHRVAGLNRGEGWAILRRLAPDLLVSAGAPEVFTPHVLHLPSIGAINIHNGRLPAYRGVFGTFWEVHNGEEWGYACVHAMAPEIDAGPVLAQRSVRLDGRGLWEILGEKKRLGGGLLAWVVRYAWNTGHLPPSCPHNDGLAPRYYTWPTLADIGRMRRARSRRRVQTPSPQPPIPAWPADFAAGDHHV